MKFNAEIGYVGQMFVICLNFGTKVMNLIPLIKNDLYLRKLQYLDDMGLKIEQFLLISEVR